MKHLAAGVLAFVLTTGCVEAVNPRYQSVVEVSYALVSPNGQRFCSATKIGYETFVTAAHCVGDKPFAVEDKNGNPVPAEVTKSLPGADLALISAPIDGPNAVLSRVEPAQGDDVVIAGFPLGTRLILTLGLWQGVGKFFGEDHYVVSAPIAPGNSGGGVFVKNGDQWELAGVAQAVPVLAEVGGVLHLAMISSYPIFKQFVKV